MIRRKTHWLGYKSFYNVYSMLEKALLIVALKFSKVVCSNIFSFLACNNEIMLRNSLNIQIVV